MKTVKASLLRSEVLNSVNYEIQQSKFITFRFPPVKLNY